MTSVFLGKTNLIGIEPLRVGQRPALDHYARLQGLLTSKLGPSAANLFAEPSVTWSDGGSVSWYTEAVGEPRPLAAVSTDRRQVLEQWLRATLAPVAALLSDAEAAPLLRCALTVVAADYLFAIDERVVIAGWGLAPNGAASAAAPAMLAGSALAPFLPSGPSATAAPAPPETPRAMPAARGEAAVVAMPAPMPAAVLERAVWNWWLVPAALLVAILFLVLGLWQGSRIVAARLAERPNTVALFDEKAARDALQRQNDQNTALEREIEERRRLLAGNVCQLDPAQAPRLGPDHAAALPPSVVPPPPGGQPFQGNLADLLTQALVIVLVPKQGAMQFGSGFFVAPDLIVTNRHVVEGASDNGIFVSNARIGHAEHAELVAETPSATAGGPDVAMLRVPALAGVQPLSFTTTVATLDPVVAAGYPALTLTGDAATQRLMQGGDAGAIPQPILTDGRINAIQDGPGGIKIMPHSANVSGGNSGGPLVDSCSRVVGINTFILTDPTQVAHNNYAQKSDTVIDFLRAHGAPITVVAGPCSPSSSPPVVQPAALAAPPTPPAPATPPAK